MEIQQASWYADYIRLLGWTVERLGSTRVFLRRFPFIGTLAKIQRSKNLPTISEIRQFVRMHHIQTIAIEPDSAISSAALRTWTRKTSSFVRINTDYFLPTKTIRVDLTPAIDDIFHRFSEAKRRAVRRAEKNTISVTQTSDIDTFIRLKNKSAGFLGFITTFGITKLWRVIPEKQKIVLLAYAPNKSSPIGGILLLLNDRIAYYWIAGATREGKKRFAPTLLVWHALQAAKARGAQTLDFVGIWDDRLPTQNLQWRGFTKFKEGFGGETLYYPLH